MAQPFAEPCSRGLIAAEPCPRELGREIAPRRRRLVLVACILASSMAFIDGSALTVALPRLREDLGADFAAVQWVLNGYVLALAALTLIGGALADVYGKARRHFGRPTRTSVRRFTLLDVTRNDPARLYKPMSAEFRAFAYPPSGCSV